MSQAQTANPHVIRLENGARVLEFAWLQLEKVGYDLPYGIVLAHTGHDYVTWRFYLPEGQTQLVGCEVGNYFWDNRAAAREDYLERVRSRG